VPKGVSSKEGLTLVTMQEIQEFMAARLKEDREIKSVTVSAETLERAIKDAAVELGVGVSRVEYDILQRGSSGLLGLGKKNWTIMAYPTAKKNKKYLKSAEELNVEEVVVVETKPKDVDGRVFVRLWADGAYLKVTKPEGAGKPATEDMAMAALQDRVVRDINHQAVKGAVKLATGTYQKVGEFIHNPAADSSVTAYLEDGDMAAYLIANAPGPGGADLSKEEIEAFLRNFGIVHGIRDDRLNDFIDSPVYGEKYLIAEGSKPINGKDARIIYHFDTKMDFKPIEKDGKVDFRNLNNIHNVVKGEELATKEPAEKGIAGRTVTGKVIPAKDGKDVNFELGNGVYLSRDGLKLHSAVDGQVLYSGGKVSVETVLTIPGNVNLASGGNINVLGSVIVKGDVEDGFNIIAGGNIEVMGSVGRDCALETPGDVILHGGINGGDHGHIKAGGSVWSKFIQRARVISGGVVIVSDGILNSEIDAEKKVLCKGKKAKIIGGHIRAGEEINAVSFGGNCVLEVGYDPKIKEELDDLLEKQDSVKKEKEEVDLNLAGLLKMLRVRKQLVAEKEKLLHELQKKSSDLEEELNHLQKEIQERQDYLNSFSNASRVAASGEIIAGVKIIIRGVEFEANRDYRSVAFILENGLIRTQKYEAIDESEIMRK